MKWKFEIINNMKIYTYVKKKLLYKKQSFILFIKKKPGYINLYDHTKKRYDHVIPITKNMQDQIPVSKKKNEWMSEWMKEFCEYTEICRLLTRL